ncbi:MAG: TOMM precursor leader peptide-binding protein [Caulobacteraceae bacterium]|nr:TOMM precursor leader peptide-binding protein [Caulobacteraceae bacterium]
MGAPPWPRLKRHYAIVAHSPDVVELRHGAWNATTHTLTDESESGRLLRLLRRIDGASGPDEIAAAEKAPLDEVEGLIGHLAELDLLETGAGNALDYLIEHATGHLAGGVIAPTPTPPIVIGDDGPLGRQIAALLGTTLDEAASSVRGDLVRCAKASLEDGLAFEEAVAPFARWRGRFLVHAAATVNPLELRGLNRVCLHHGLPAIAAAVDGPFLLVGPTVIPGRTACFECLDKRVLMNLREAASYQAYKSALLDGRVGEAAGAINGVFSSLLASLASVEALNFSLAGTTMTVGKVLGVFLPTMEFTYNEVLRVPGCPACGAAPERDDRELYFDIRAILPGKT